MALSSLSLMNYGLEVTTLNQNLDFLNVSSGSVNTAVIPLGFYSSSGLAQAVALAMQSVDLVNSYTVSVDRNVLGGTQNRITIASSGTFLTLLFGSGPNLITSIGPLLGFNQADYIGSTTYTGSQSTGTPLIPEFFAYSYLDTNNMAKVFGAVNISTSGLKEAVVFQIQQFIQLSFCHEPFSNLPQWTAFFLWAIQQRPFDFIPQISDPSTSFQVTLDKTQYDAQGLGYQMSEELPDFPNLYQTGPMVYRVIAANQEVITGD